MPTRQEALLIYLPALLLIGAIAGFSCWRDARALSDPSPIITTAPVKP